jgi:hypothetical protein
MCRIGIAALILMTTAIGRTAWERFPSEVQADVWNASQALVLIVMSCVAAIGWRSRVIGAMCVLVIALNTATVACSAYWYIAPWAPMPGRDICDQALGWPLSLLFLLAFVIASMFVSKARQNNEEGRHDTTDRS